jgi:hypothetical protein
MSNLAFQKLLELVNFDQKVHKTRVEIEGLNEEVESLQKQVDRLNERLQLVKNEWEDARQAVSLKELEMKSLDESEKKAHKKLDSVQDQKEYQSIKKEIEHLKEKQHGFEQILLAAWNTVETAEREYKSKQEVHDAEQKKLEDEIAQKRAKVEELQETVIDSESERTKLVVDIPHEWLETYERMQSRVSNPVVPVVNNACGACNFTISAVDMMQLRNRALLQCKHCYRFLYLESAMQS